ncbi:MAG: hypothetical protein HKN27_15040 [Silicimonas sp.]|nr:hypothetical protein [Silicimonas sp.]
MKYIIEFFVSALLWFWIFVYLFKNPDIILEHRAVAGGILFTLGFGRWLFLVATEDPKRIPVMLTFVLGMASGIGAAGILFVPEMRGVPG